jgi:hypothetical protein
MQCDVLLFASIFGFCQQVEFYSFGFVACVVLVFYKLILLIFTHFVLALHVVVLITMIVVIVVVVVYSRNIVAELILCNSVINKFLPILYCFFVFFVFKSLTFC